MLKEDLLRLIQEQVPDGADVHVEDRHGGDDDQIEIKGGFYHPSKPKYFLLAGASPWSE